MEIEDLFRWADLDRQPNLLPPFSDTPGDRKKIYLTSPLRLQESAFDKPTLPKVDRVGCEARRKYKGGNRGWA